MDTDIGWLRHIPNNITILLLPLGQFMRYINRFEMRLRLTIIYYRIQQLNVKQLYLKKLLQKYKGVMIL